jgi:hypothetical protein
MPETAHLVSNEVLQEFLQPKAAASCAAPTVA